VAKPVLEVGRPEYLSGKASSRHSDEVLILSGNMMVRCAVHNAHQVSHVSLHLVVILSVFKAEGPSMMSNVYFCHGFGSAFS